MSEALDKVLTAVEPNGVSGWGEYVLSAYYKKDDTTMHESALIAIAAEENEYKNKELSTLRARVAELEKQLKDRDEMLQEERE